MTRSDRPFARPAGLALAALVPALLAAAPPARASVTYTFTTLNDPNADLTQNSAADGVNDSGQVVGYYTAPNGIQHGFLYNNGSFTDFDDPNTSGQFNTNPTGINNNGQIVGNYLDNNGDLKGFLYTPGTGGLGNASNYTDLVPSPTTTNQNGVIFANATGIGNNGEVIGYQNGPNSTSNFIYSGGTNGTFSSLDVPNSQSNSTGLGGINGSGQVAGSYTDSNGDGKNFLYTPGAGGGQFSDLPSDPGDANAPAGGGTYVSGINDNGQVVGIYTDAYGFNHGFLESGGTFTNFEDPDADPGYYGTNAYGTNNLGQIVGVYTDSNGANQAFLATPNASAAPEPSQVGMIVLIGAGLGGLLLRARKQRRMA